MGVLIYDFGSLISPRIRDGLEFSLGSKGVGWMGFILQLSEFHRSRASRNGWPICSHLPKKNSGRSHKSVAVCSQKPVWASKLACYMWNTLVKSPMQEKRGLELAFEIFVAFYVRILAHLLTKMVVWKIIYFDVTAIFSPWDDLESFSLVQTDATTH